MEPIESPGTQDVQVEPEGVGVSNDFPFFLRVVCGTFIAVAPPFCFFFYPGGQRPSWQGEENVFSKLMLEAGQFFPLFPLLAWTIVSGVYFCFDPDKAEKSRAVQTGIAGGIPMGFLVSWLLYHDLLTWLLVGAGIAGLAISIAGFCRSIRAGVYLSIIYVVVCAVVLVSIYGFDDAYGMIRHPFAIPLFALALNLYVSPFCFLLCYIYFLVLLLRWRFLLSSIIGVRWIVMWGIGFVACYGLAYRRTMEALSRLPEVKPEDCFLATAGAQGHPWLVRSWEWKTKSGATRVNRQLALLKAGEMVIQATSPRTHALMRRIYNRYGPPLAAKVRHPLVADALYLALKPIEWTVALVLAVAFPAVKAAAQRLYR